MRAACRLYSDYILLSFELHIELQPHEVVEFWGCSSVELQYYKNAQSAVTVIILYNNILAEIHKTIRADLGILVGGVTLFATPIIYLQHLFSKFHYQLSSPWWGGG